MGSVPSQGTIDYSQLSIGELLERLPTEKIKKQRDKPVEVSRPPEEQAVLKELWKRYLVYHKEKGHIARVRGMCPNDGRGHFYDAVMKNAEDAFMRLIVRTTEENEIYKDFFYFVDKSVFNKARDLRRSITGNRPKRQSPSPSLETEQEVPGAPADLSLDELKEKGFSGPSVPPLDPELKLLCRSLHSRQRRVQGTASNRALEIGCLQAWHTPNVPRLIRAEASSIACRSRTSEWCTPI